MSSPARRDPRGADRGGGRHRDRSTDQAPLESQCIVLSATGAESTNSLDLVEVEQQPETPVAAHRSFHAFRLVPTSFLQGTRDNTAAVASPTEAAASVTPLWRQMTKPPKQTEPQSQGGRSLPAPSLQTFASLLVATRAFGRIETHRCPDATKERLRALLEEAADKLATAGGVGAPLPREFCDPSSDVGNVLVQRVPFTVLRGFLVTSGAVVGSAEVSVRISGDAVLVPKVRLIGRKSHATCGSLMLLRPGGAADLGLRVELVATTADTDPAIAPAATALALLFKQHRVDPAGLSQQSVPFERRFRRMALCTGVEYRVTAANAAGGESSSVATFRFESRNVVKFSKDSQYSSVAEAPDPQESGASFLLSLSEPPPAEAAEATAWPALALALRVLDAADKARPNETTPQHCGLDAPFRAAAASPTSTGNQIRRTFVVPTMPDASAMEASGGRAFTVGARGLVPWFDGPTAPKYAPLPPPVVASLTEVLGSLFERGAPSAAEASGGSTASPTALFELVVGPARFLAVRDPVSTVHHPSAEVETSAFAPDVRPVTAPTTRALVTVSTSAKNSEATAMFGCGADGVWQRVDATDPAAHYVQLPGAVRCVRLVFARPNSSLGLMLSGVSPHAARSSDQDADASSPAVSGENGLVGAQLAAANAALASWNRTGTAVLQSGVGLLSFRVVTSVDLGVPSSPSTAARLRASRIQQFFAGKPPLARYALSLLVGGDSNALAAAASAAQAAGCSDALAAFVAGVALPALDTLCPPVATASPTAPLPVPTLDKVTLFGTDRVPFAIPAAAPIAPVAPTPPAAQPSSTAVTPPVRKAVVGAEVEGVVANAPANWTANGDQKLPCFVNAGFGRLVLLPAVSNLAVGDRVSIVITEVRGKARKRIIARLAKTAESAVGAVVDVDDSKATAAVPTVGTEVEAVVSDVDHLKRGTFVDASFGSDVLLRGVTGLVKGSRVAIVVTEVTTVDKRQRVRARLRDALPAATPPTPGEAQATLTSTTEVANASREGDSHQQPPAAEEAKTTPASRFRPARSVSAPAELPPSPPPAPTPPPTRVPEEPQTKAEQNLQPVPTARLSCGPSDPLTWDDLFGEALTSAAFTSSTGLAAEWASAARDLGLTPAASAARPMDLRTRASASKFLASISCKSAGRVPRDVIEHVLGARGHESENSCLSDGGASPFAFCTRRVRAVPAAAAAAGACDGVLALVEARVPSAFAAAMRGLSAGDAHDLNGNGSAAALVGHYACEESLAAALEALRAVDPEAIAAVCDAERLVAVLPTTGGQSQSQVFACPLLDVDAAVGASSGPPRRSLLSRGPRLFPVVSPFVPFSIFPYCVATAFASSSAPTSATALTATMDAKGSVRVLLRCERRASGEVTLAPFADGGAPLFYRDHLAGFFPRTAVACGAGSGPVAVMVPLLFRALKSPALWRRFVR